MFVRQKKNRSLGDQPARQLVVLNVEVARLDVYGARGIRSPLVVVYARSLAKGSASRWREVGATEPVSNRINPKFVKHFEFEEEIARDTLLRFELYKTEQALGRRRTLVASTETSLALILKSEFGVLECELENGEGGEMTGALLYAMAHRVEPMLQQEIVFDIAWKGVGMAGEGSKVVISRRIPGCSRYTPVYSSETLTRSGPLEPIRLSSSAMVEGMATRLLLSFIDVTTAVRLALLEAPIGALLSLSQSDKPEVWHEEVHVDVSNGSITIPSHFITQREIRIKLSAVIHRRRLLSPPPLQSRQGSQQYSRQLSRSTPDGMKTPATGLLSSRQQSMWASPARRLESINEGEKLARGLSERGKDQKTASRLFSVRGISMSMATPYITSVHGTAAS